MILRTSARNRIRSNIIKINIEGLISNLELETMENTTLTAIITRESADELELKEGDTINLVIKPTEIIIKELEV